MNSENKSLKDKHKTSYKKPRNLFLVTLILILPAFMLYGCSLGLTGTNKGSKKELDIGVIVPLSGDLSASGNGIKNSVALAVRNINDSKMLPNIKLKVVAKDDAGVASTARQVASSMANEKNIIGVVGTLNSSTAEVVMPILDKVHIAMVSPANTSNSLTQGPNWETNKKRPYRGYYRVVGYDANQGKIAADYIKQEMHLQRVAVINNKLAYGVGLANSFVKSFTALGGDVVLNDTVDQNEKNFSSIIAKIKAQNPQLVYFGGEFNGAALLSYQMKNSGLQVPLFGGDGIYDDGYIPNCSGKCDGDYATVTGDPLTDTEGGKKFIKQYNDMYHDSAYSPYGGQAYDATYTIANAIATSLSKQKQSNNVPSREDVQNNIQYTNFPGVTSVIHFDNFGDIIAPKFSVYVVQNKEWHFIKSVSVDSKP
jgi:branched-chain amino acid transport system substrate-binding protein